MKYTNLLHIVLVGLILISSYQPANLPAQASTAAEDQSTDLPMPDVSDIKIPDLKELGNGLSPQTAIAAEQLSDQLGNQLSASDWLGPLAPIALSPFFGLTCLSGMALYGESILGDNNALLQAAGPLKNPAVFWTFLALTIATSIPRFSKVSKPFAQAVDKIEAFAGIITLITIRFMMSGESSGEMEVATVYQLGMFSFTAETLLSLATVINVLAINSVKFFFEVLIWLTPVPFLDAIFEVANKSACAAMMALYAFSPTMATVLNLAMFIACAMIFRWVYRREVYYRHVIVDAVRSWWGASGVPGDSIVVFPTNDVGAIPAKAKCSLIRSDDGWKLTHRPWIGRTLEHAFGKDNQLHLSKGWFTTKFDLRGPDETVLVGTRRYHNHLDAIGGTLLASEVTKPESLSWAGLKSELA